MTQWHVKPLLAVSLGNRHDRKYRYAVIHLVIYTDIQLKHDITGVKH